jgi:hypothetical protein
MTAERLAKSTKVPTAEKQDWDKRKDQKPSCDKGGHAERSKANDQGQHNKHKPK